MSAAQVVNLYYRLTGDSLGSVTEQVFPEYSSDSRPRKPAVVVLRVNLGDEEVRLS